LFGEDIIIPIAGMLTGIVVVIAISVSLAKIFRGPVGQALGRRIAGKGAQQDQEVISEVLELRHQVEQLSQRLGDAEERLDFSERLLAQRSEAGERRS